MDGEIHRNHRCAGSNNSFRQTSGQLVDQCLRATVQPHRTDLSRQGTAFDILIPTMIQDGKALVILLKGRKTELVDPMCDCRLEGRPDPGRAKISSVVAIVIDDRSDPTAWPVFGLDDPHRSPGVDQQRSGRETSQTAADDPDLGALLFDGHEQSITSGQRPYG